MAEENGKSKCLAVIVRIGVYALLQKEAHFRMVNIMETNSRKFVDLLWLDTDLC